MCEIETEGYVRLQNILRFLDRTLKELRIDVLKRLLVWWRVVGCPERTDVRVRVSPALILLSSCPQIY